MEMTLRWYGSKFDTVTLKQIRQIPYFLNTLCGLPHLLQRVYSRTLNFCGLLAFAIILFLAIFTSTIS